MLLRIVSRVMNLGRRIRLLHFGSMLRLFACYFYYSLFTRSIQTRHDVAFGLLPSRSRRRRSSSHRWSSYSVVALSSPGGFLRISQCPTQHPYIRRAFTDRPTEAGSSRCPSIDTLQRRAANPRQPSRRHRHYQTTTLGIRPRRYISNSPSDWAAS